MARVQKSRRVEDGPVKRAADRTTCSLLDGKQAVGRIGRLRICETHRDRVFAICDSVRVPRPTLDPM